MKLILIILALAAVGGWYMFNQAKENKDVQKAQNAAVQYTETLQKDVEKAKDAAAKANEAIKNASDQVQKALP